MARLVIVRHGQSQANLANIFTGWTDSPLTPHGIAQAQAVGRLLAQRGYQYGAVHTSYMQRAIKTANLILAAQDQLYVPMFKTWRLNERHYGALSGQNKAAVKAKVGAAQLQAWRRGYTAVPPQLPRAQHEARYDRLGVAIPRAESLAMTERRLVPYWQDQIAPRLLAGQDQLVVAHGSSLRALIKYLEEIGDAEIDRVEVPNAEPIVYQLDTRLQIQTKEIIDQPNE